MSGAWPDSILTTPDDLRDACVASLLKMAATYARVFSLNQYDLLSEACLRAQTDEAVAWGDRKADG